MSQTPYKPEIALITGATGDFGKAFAHGLAALGTKILVHGRSKDKVEKLSAELKTQTYPIVFDVTDKAATIEQINAIPPEFQNIDLLINNAGGALGLDPAHKADLEDWEMMIEMNDKALVRITRLILPGMTQRKRGHIINIGSTAGNYPYPGGNVYCASKAFVKQFSLSIRADLVGTKVRVTNIEPGQVETQFSTARFKGDAQKAAAVYANTENITAADIADAVIWAATRPPRLNINRMEIMPTTQSFGPLPVERF